MTQNIAKEQLLPAAKLGLASSDQAWQTIFEAAEGLRELFFKAAHEVLVDVQRKTELLQSLKSQEDISKLPGTLTGANTQRLVDYSTKLYQLSFSATNELFQILQAQITESNKMLGNTFQNSVKTLPGGKEIGEAMATHTGQLTDSYAKALTTVLGMIGPTKGKM